MSLFPTMSPGEKPPAQVSNVSDDQSSSAASSFSFTSQAFGAADASRKLVLTGSTSDTSGSNITVVTIGGVSASLVIAANATNRHTAIWQADVPTGTSGTVAVTTGANTSGCGIALFRVVGAGTGPTAASATGSDTTADGSALSDTLTIPAGGIAIGSHMGADSSGTTWTYLTEATDDDYEGGSHRHSSASIASTAGVTDQEITADQAGGGNGSMALATWGPA